MRRASAYASILNARQSWFDLSVLFLDSVPRGDAWQGSLQMSVLSLGSARRADGSAEIACLFPVPSAEFKLLCVSAQGLLHLS